MGELPYAKSFRDLLAYQKARQLAREIFQITARSIGAQIAEAWAKRRYERHFLSKLTDADGEQQETQHWIETAADCGYLTQKQAAVLIRKYEEIGRLLGGMMAKADLFCREPKRALCETTAEYFVTDQ